MALREDISDRESRVICVRRMDEYNNDNKLSQKTQKTARNQVERVCATFHKCRIGMTQRTMPVDESVRGVPVLSSDMFP